jgi:hypothetical protein
VSDDEHPIAVAPVGVGEDPVQAGGRDEAVA